MNEKLYKELIQRNIFYTTILRRDAKVKGIFGSKKISFSLEPNIILDILRENLIWFLPEKVIENSLTQDLVKKIIKFDFNTIKLLPPRFITDKIREVANRIDPNLLLFFDEDHLQFDMLQGLQSFPTKSVSY